MPFHYTIEIFVNEIKAKNILHNPVIKELANKNNTILEYEDNKLRLICAENQDLDEELVKKILATLKGAVKAKAYLIDGKSRIEIFNGTLDPKNPFGRAKDDISERTIESLEEDETVHIDDDLEDFLNYNEDEE
ncbi:hypothetical protein [Thermosipho atlanticus]|uniref:Uncharacterized protein n=1 Tax=Thermosipho atlanticus DSM 15807 TaxID=1123380 RepID=A0A1M5SS42_9BACT|nr:hypothetical protein [Thermosipho atlanticus]SHH40793.1 hypothetical protein SAMN02745199_1017 [Thermosipho atlanticus DSM 15807]